MEVATSPRQTLKIYFRRLLAHSYYGIARLLRTASGLDNKIITSILTYPVIKDISNLSDIVNRIAWYLPKTDISSVEIFIPVDPKLLNVSITKLAPPSFQENFLCKLGNVHLINSSDDLNKCIDAILLWDTRKMFSPYILSHLARVFIVDPNFYHSFEAFTYPRLFNLTISDEFKVKIAEKSKDNFRKLLRELDGCQRGFIFATGPSLESATDFDYSGGFRIICNTIVKNQELLKHIKPQLLIFLDETAFYSVSRYSANFRKMVLETVRQFQCYIMMPDYLAALLTAHYPELLKKIICIQTPGLREMNVGDIVKMLCLKPWRFLSFQPELDKIPGKNERYNFPTPDKMYVRNSSSVLTSHLIPVASSVCNEIYFVGADGRKPGEKYFWSHAKLAQFGDLMQTLFDTHPSFFRDSVYTDYYRKHCNYFERIVSYGEDLGKQYYSLTPSYIPALAKRPAPHDKIKRVI